jgi:hypothetical protein
MELKFDCCYSSGGYYSIMTARILTGSKAEIAQKVASLEGDVRQAIVFVDEPRVAPPRTYASAEQLFAEMEPYTARAGRADYSRSGIYSRTPSE